MHSVLSLATRSDLILEPFPHVVVRDALDDELCDRLIAEFPPLESMVGWSHGASNMRLYYRAKTARTDPNLSRLWRELIETHTSQAFLDEILAVFGDAIVSTYPDFEARYGSLGSLRAGLRFSDTFEDADVLLEAQPSANTPVTAEPTSVRAGHLDNPNKLVVGLLYLRRPDDDSTGGDLELYRYGTRWPVFDGHEIADRYIEPVKTISYEKNVLVMFLNSPRSLHGVTVRQRTPVPRLFFNLNAEVRSDLFVMPGRRRRAVRRVQRVAPRLHTNRARVAAVVLGVLMVLAGLLTLVPEALGDHPYDVF